MVTLAPEVAILLSAPLFDPEGILYIICGAGQTDRSSSASGQLYCAPDICSQFNTLPQLQLQLSEKTYLDLELFAIVFFKGRSCFLTFFAGISWTDVVLKEKKKNAQPLSPANKLSEERGWGGKRYPSTPRAPPPPPWSFLDCNFIYFQLFLS